MNTFKSIMHQKSKVNSSEGIIIPIASGKGGVGKTFMAANLAIALAELGHTVIAMDLDIGGSNLHSFFGFPNRYPGIGDFLKARVGELDELLIPTATPNLSFLPGDGKTPFMANIAYAQKVKLVSRIRKLPADYILLDLGAGSSFNVLDFFRISPRGIMVTTPEPPAVMGMLVFLKNFLFRSIERELARNYPIRNLLQELYKHPMEEQVPSMQEVKQKITDEDPQAGEAVIQIYQRCRPRVIFNMGESPDDCKMAFQITRTLEQILSIEADYFGFIFKDKSVVSAIRNRRSFLPDHRNSPAAENIVRIAQRIVKFWNQSVNDSAALLFNHAKRDFEALQQSSFAA